MEVFKGKNDAAQNEPDSMLTSLEETIGFKAILFNDSVEVTSLGPFQNKVVVILISERTVERGNKGTFILF